MKLHDVDIPQASIAQFCARHHVRSLALFGSILTDDFGEDSDIDILVEFEPDEGPGLFGFAGMQTELTSLLKREVHLHTPAMLPPRSRTEVQRRARVQYAAA